MMKESGQILGKEKWKDGIDQNKEHMSEFSGLSQLPSSFKHTVHKSSPFFLP